MRPEHCANDASANLATSVARDRGGRGLDPTVSGAGLSWQLQPPEPVARVAHGLRERKPAYVSSGPTWAVLGTSGFTSA